MPAPRPTADSEAGLQIAADWVLDSKTSRGQNRMFWSAWYCVNALLLVSAFGAIYMTAWEYSTRRYLKGFSDAVIPETAPPEEKIQSILSWMSSPAAQRTPAFVGEPSDRNPIDTLNFQALLRVCGTATNAFVNLAVSDGLASRRLLLLDSYSATKHVDAEVLMDGRWIVVDPAFRLILRSPDGKTLTREELAVPAVFAAATRNIPHYDPSYSFESTTHVRLARLGVIAGPVQRVLRSLIPGWDHSVMISLILERQSLARMIVAIAIFVLLSLVRSFLRWYGEGSLHISSISFRHRLFDAYRAFVKAST